MTATSMCFGFKPLLRNQRTKITYAVRRPGALFCDSRLNVLLRLRPEFQDGVGIPCTLAQNFEEAWDIQPALPGGRAGNLKTHHGRMAVDDEILYVKVHHVGCERIDHDRRTFQSTE